ncbi:MAG: hypothetical protein LC798_05360 [Chloroflexi bacterium]|nr:hypothetical protein [Chloroflexota bacterium]
MATRRGSLRWLVQQGYTMYEARQIKGAERGLRPREAVGKGRPERGELQGPRQAAERGLLGRLAPLQPPTVRPRGKVPIVGGTKRGTVGGYLSRLGIGVPAFRDGSFTITIAGVGTLGGLSRAAFLRIYNQLRDRGVDFVGSYAG